MEAESEPQLLTLPDRLIEHGSQGGAWHRPVLGFSMYKAGGSLNPGSLGLSLRAVWLLRGYVGFGPPPDLALVSSCVRWGAVPLLSQQSFCPCTLYVLALPSICLKLLVPFPSLGCGCLCKLSGTKCLLGAETGECSGGLSPGPPCWVGLG